MHQLFSDEYYMKKALEEAKTAYEKGEIPVGCIVVCKNKIIARCYNLTQTLNDVTAHAEMQAITAASNMLGGKYLTDCSLYVTLEPCVMCAGALNWAQIGKVVYGATDDKRGFSLYSTTMLHPRTEIITGVLKDECSSMLKNFFLNRRK
ncbi:MAG: nucleoside deaminase [Prolixibacteraceae bacterium]|nr:nucleoside deaminase [Prolixibacteraceae bacterium]